MQPSDASRDVTRLRTEWERFVGEGMLSAGMDPVVSLSWQRCAPRLDPRGAPQWAYLSPSMLPLTSVQHSFLRMVARPVMEDVYQFIEGSGHLLVLTDSSACVFEMLGDPAIEDHVRGLGFRPGAFLDEGRIGTNAFSLALAEGFPVQIVGPEHFLLAFHGLHSMAAPLYDPHGSPIGSIGMIERQGPCVSPSLGTVFAAAKAIENQLQAEHFIREANAQTTEFNATLDAISEGILAWTAQGFVTHLNGRGGELLGIKPSLVVGRPLMDRITLPESISRAAGRGEELNDVEASCKVDGEKHDVSVSLRIIRDQKGEPLAFITTLRPMAQVHQLVTQLLGSQARLTLDDIVGQGPAARRMRRQALAAVGSRESILLVGEQGTGKNSLARAIHNCGGRASGPFLSINCHAIPRELVIEEFLGFEPGAFSNATSTGQPSKFELADGGTLFIEEIDALPLEMQSILARILRSGEVVRLGGKRAMPVDVRVIASTEQNLEERTRTGSFRPDLFHFLDAAMIHLPPLRERAEDIPLLIGRSLDRMRLQFGRALSVSPKAREMLCAYPWPGNIAELESVMELATFNSDGQEIEGAHLAESLGGEGVRAAGRSASPAVSTMREMERQAIADALRATRGNHSKAARMLAISRNTLYRKIREMEIGPSGEEAAQ
ncbi:MAG TPA: sigma 54-interacting transcriptional regulator [Holophaga sp.]|nr:sigma 54-interacting transcriptional regulator [Holophaga sp.]HPS68546.1 sigma 54-interacting transcriptional regulator [Holophaga sp.]